MGEWACVRAGCRESAGGSESSRGRGRGSGSNPHWVLLLGQHDFGWKQRSIVLVVGTRLQRKKMKDGRANPWSMIRGR